MTSDSQFLGLSSTQYSPLATGVSLRLALLVFFGLAENFGYMIVGPAMAYYLGMLSGDMRLSVFGGYGVVLSDLLKSSFCLPAIVLTIFSFRGIYLWLLHDYCRSKYQVQFEALENPVRRLFYSTSSGVATAIKKALLSDLPTAIYSYHYNRLILASLILPFLLLTVYCVIILGPTASSILAGLVAVLLVAIRRLIRFAEDIGRELNAVNVVRFDETDEFSTAGRLAILMGRFSSRWRRLKNVNRQFWQTQFWLQVLSAVPKFLVEIFLIIGIVTVFIYFRALGRGPDEFLASLTMVSAALYRLMPVGNSLVTAFMQMAAARDPRISLEKLLVSAEIDESYVKPDDQIELGVEALYVKGRLGNENRTLSFTLKHPGVYAFKGRSGAGKTTLSDVLSGLLAPSGGRVFVGARHFNSSGALILSRSFQDPIVIKGDLRENISFGASESPRVSDLIRRIGLLHLDDGRELSRSLVNSAISGGEARRVDFLRSIVADSNLVILDEPEAGLDVSSKQGLLAVLKELGANRTVLVFTHDQEVMAHCGRVIDIENELSGST